MKISIITVCKNSEKFIENTIKSVTTQTHKDIEYIVIDGKSTDHTIEIIQKYIQYITYFSSEDDGGMYEAINKGLNQATGEYFLILNSDDMLANSSVIDQVVKIIENERLDYYYGNMIKLKQVFCKKVRLFNVSYKKLLLSTHGTFVPHPCFFISASLNKQIGGYNTEYKYASDYDYILKALAFSHKKGKHIQVYTTVFRIHSDSITASGKIDSERKKILYAHKYFKIPFFTRMFAFFTLWLFYKMLNLRFRFIELTNE